MRLIIIGPMASGKSVVGKKLSKRMGLNFFDTDEYIASKAGASISWIFDIEGERKFRDREFEVLNNLVTEENCVISTGGGIVLRKENRELLKKGTTIYLEISIQSQLERTMNDKNRPLLQQEVNKEETLRKIATLRNPLYLKCSDIVISETNDVNESVDRILREIGRLK